MPLNLMGQESEQSAGNSSERLEPGRDESSRLGQGNNGQDEHLDLNDSGEHIAMDQKNTQ